MRILIFDRNHLNALAQAISLSGNGLIVETVPSLAEVEHRLETMDFDAVLLNDSTPERGGKRPGLQKEHPHTKFFTPEQIVQFIEFIEEKEQKDTEPRCRESIKGENKVG